jgi:hypothetical protein
MRKEFFLDGKTVLAVGDEPDVPQGSPGRDRECLSKLPVRRGSFLYVFLFQCWPLNLCNSMNFLCLLTLNF